MMSGMSGDGQSEEPMGAPCLAIFETWEFVVEQVERRVPHISRFSRYGSFNYSYRNASAGSTLAADHDGYSVAMNDTPIATAATRIPSCTRMANGT